MITFDECRKLALALADVTEEPHFEKPSFRWRGKIFMTFHTPKNQAMLILPELHQSVLTADDNEFIFPVKGFWGSKGATMFDLNKVTKKIFKDALKSSYNFIVEKNITKKNKSKL